jgi:hypothetical protein
VRVASVNLNKRVGAAGARTLLVQWLAHNDIGLLLAQEPWRPPGRDAVQLDGFCPIGGTDKVFAWVQERFEAPSYQQLAPHWRRLELGYVAVHHAYLDAHAQRTRAAQLDQLRNGMATEGVRPMLAVGDFNLAPRPQDGLLDSHASTFNSSTDRGPFHSLLAACLLHDATAADPPQFSVARSARGKRWEFRCDLALVSDYLAPSVIVTYDHSVRTGATAFSDHSALLIDLPVSPPQAFPPRTPFLSRQRSPRAIQRRPTHPKGATSSRELPGLQDGNGQTERLPVRSQGPGGPCAQAVGRLSLRLRLRPWR